MKVFDERVHEKTFTEPYFGARMPIWGRLEEVTGTDETEKYFIINVKANNHPECLYISLPAEGGVRVQSLHEAQKNAGLTEPEVNNAGQLEPSALVAIQYKKDGDAVILTGTDGTIVRYEPCERGFVLKLCRDGEQIMEIRDRQFAYHYDCRGEVVSTLVEMPLVEKEAICGGGERFNHSNHVGFSFSLCNADSPSTLEFTYTNIPLFHSTRGYSVWFNMTAPGWADFGDANPEKYSISFDQHGLDLYLWAGTPLENLKKYTDITGTTGVTDTWSYGFWTGAAEAAYQNCKKKNQFENLKDLFEGYKEHYNFYPEACYGEGTNGREEEPIKYSNDRNIRMQMWYPPFYDHYIKKEDMLPGSSVYPVYDEQGNMIDPGHPLPYDDKVLRETGEYKFAGNGIDFTHPNAGAYIDQLFGPYWDFGVRGCMLDMGELHPYYGKYFNGMDGKEMHNFISYYYAKTIAERWTKRLKNDYVLFLRSGTAGSQKFACNFLGDQWATWTYFQRIVYSMIGMGASGYNLYGADLGALLSKPTDDLWNRWVVLATFSPFMRQHGAANIHMPWSDYGALAKKAFGNYYYFRKNIVPTVESAAICANKTANPLVKGMIFAYPEQTALQKADVQYLFCNDFLVCPVLEENVWYNKVMLPAGSTWYDLYSYKAYAGGQTVMAEAPTSTMPVFVKGGAVKAINLPQSLTLGAEMHDASGDAFEAMPALLITAPDAENEVTFYVKDGDSTDFRTYESHTEKYTITPAGDAFKLQNVDGADRRIVLALGVTAAKVTVDGKTLACLDHKPVVADNEIGYHVDRQGMTTVVLPAGWKVLEITKAESTYVPLPLTSAAANTVDGKAETAAVLPAGGALTVELEEAAEIDRVVIKWATGYCSAYNVECSADGESWAVLKTVTDSVGSVNAIDVAPVTVKALRLVPVAAGDAAVAPAVYAFEAYAPAK